MKNNIEIITAIGAGVSEKVYLEAVKELIIETIQTDPTVVLHSDEEIISRYKHSLVAIRERKIIANSSVYPTHMKPLDNLSLNGKKIHIGECGTTVVKQEFRKIGLGREMVIEGLKQFGPSYDVLVGATVNDVMYTLRCGLGFEKIPFPKEYYEEGRMYLASKMKGGLKEFDQRAKCIMHFQNTSQEIKKYILDILTKQ